MPLLETSRKQQSELIAALSKIGHEGAINYHYARVTVKGTDLIEPIGIPVIWNNTISAYEVYVAQDIAAVAGTPSLPNGAPIALVVGAAEYVGSNKADVQLVVGGVELNVLFRGEGAVKEAGITWGAAAAPAQAAFRLQLEKQNLAVVANSTVAIPAFTA